MCVLLAYESNYICCFRGKLMLVVDEFYVQLLFYKRIVHSAQMTQKLFRYMHLREIDKERCFAAIHTPAIWFAYAFLYMLLC